MHTLKTVLGGVVLLALCLVGGWWLRGRTVRSRSVPAGAPETPDHVTVALRSVSPSGARHALLIRRSNRVALNDLYLVAVGAAREPVDSAAVSRIGRDSAALVATRADRVRLEWQSDTELVVVCDACGLVSADLVQSRGRAGGARVAFRGFPARDGFGRPVPPARE